MGIPAHQEKKHLRVEALRNHRHHSPGGHWYSKENAVIRKMTRRVFRRKLKRESWNEPIIASALETTKHMAILHGK